MPERSVSDELDHPPQRSNGEHCNYQCRPETQIRSLYRVPEDLEPRTEEEGSQVGAEHEQWAKGEIDKTHDPIHKGKGDCEQTVQTAQRESVYDLLFHGDSTTYASTDSGAL